MPVNRLELLRQLAAMPEGIEMLDAMLASFTFICRFNDEAPIEAHRSSVSV